VSVMLGTGVHRYEAVSGWAKLPPGYEFNADVAGVGVDAQDRVYCFNRGTHPMVVLDRDGNFLRSWGEGVFKRAHGVHMAPDDTLWLTDDGDHTVRHCTLDGKVYCVPVNIHSWQWLWLSNKAFEDAGVAVPTNWDEFIARHQKTVDTLVEAQDLRMHFPVGSRSPFSRRSDCGNLLATQNISRFTKQRRSSTRYLRSTQRRPKV